MKNPNLETDAVAVDLARSLVYRFLATCLNPPSTAVLDDLRAMAKGIQHACQGVAPEQEFSAIGQALEAMTVDAMRTESDLLFGHAVRGPVPLYEAEYGTERDVFQQSQEIADVAAFYAAAGLRRRESLKERSDHLRLELELGQVLARRQAHAGEMQDDANLASVTAVLTKFLSDHLGRKGSSIFKKMSFEPGFFGCVGMLGHAFLAAELERLGVPIEPECLTLRPSMLDQDEELRCGGGAALVAPRGDAMEV